MFCIDGILILSGLTNTHTHHHHFHKLYLLLKIITIIKHHHKHTHTHFSVYSLIWIWRTESIMTSSPASHQIPPKMGSSSIVCHSLPPLFTQPVCHLCLSLSPCLFLSFFFSTKLFFLPQLPHCRYGRVQSVKIVTSGTVSSASVTTISAAESSSDHHLSSSTPHHHPHHQSKSATNSSSSSVLAPVVGCESNGGAAAVGVTSCSSNNVSSSNQSSGGAIGICATIAFMDIKSASKAHHVEHKFDDRILTTEYYEPSAMQHGSSSGEGGSLVINNKMIGESGDAKQEHGHPRFASTSSHGLVCR
jgi:hypothetical protein